MSIAFRLAFLSVPTLALTSAIAVAFPPPAPTPCTATIVNTPTQKGVSLTWTNVAGEDGYTITRNGILVARVGADVTTFLNAQYPERGSAVYCVEAFNVDGSSPPACASASSAPAPAAYVDGPDWYQDTFSSNETPGLPGTAPFDTTTAYITSGRNLASLTGNASRYDLPQGWARVTPTAAVARVDLVFRVLPGPGNYRLTPGPWSPPQFPPTPAMVLLNSPRYQMSAAGPNDGSFWGQYLANPGQFSAGTHYSGTRWDDQTWNSAQCALVGGYYITNTFADPNMKIIPDTVLTAGSHVDYFFRVQLTDNSVVLLPDTTKVLQSGGDDSIDGRRWQQFSVLPDMWKDPAFGGNGLAQALVVDLCSGHGAKRIWTGIADSTGATFPGKYGAGDGWHAVGNGADIDDPANNRLQDNVTQGFVAENLGAPGTTWDLYTVQGPDDDINGQAGALGGRLAPRPGGAAYLESRQGPTLEMLRTYYRMILIFTGDRHSGILGPFNDRGQDDVSLLEDFLTTAQGTPQPRGLYLEGEGLVECEANPALPPAHHSLLADYLGTSFRDADYRDLSKFGGSSAQLTTVPPHTQATFDCQMNGDPDVLQPDPGLGEAMAVEYWQNLGTHGPYVASVYKPQIGLRDWVSLVDGWNMARLGTGRGYVCTGCVSLEHGPDADALAGTATSRSRNVYYLETFNDLFGGVAQLTPGSPTTVPNAARLAPTLRVLGNPVRDGEVRMRFSIPKQGRVRIDVFDIAGRRVRALLDRDYAAGNWGLVWDAHDGGAPARPGLYFVRLGMGGDAARATAHVLLLRP